MELKAVLAERLDTPVLEHAIRMVNGILADAERVAELEAVACVAVPVVEAD
ncbi:MAG: hypothetical protein KQJ78_11220 [Deltaproteobacteria bacterium]|nr:hypothetical protein [Deltaproteobacteria bacterium]